MKCACDRCEKVTTIGSAEYKNWRRIIITQPDDIFERGLGIGMGNIDTILLCDKCHDDFLDFTNHELYKPGARQAEKTNP